MKKKIEVEDILFSQESVNNLIKRKMEDEINQKQEEVTAYKPKTITDIKNVPRELIFSRKTIFKVFNRENQTVSYINGMQAEAYAASQKSVYEKLRNAQTDAFYSENMYIKFDKCKIA